MCGIAGYWSIADINYEYLDSDLKMAVQSLDHRGPDDNGIWSNASGVGLGHSRLSILDLSSHGHQPMKSRNDRFIMVFNGEVYNFREIRSELIEKGYSFFSDSDSEVVLASFQEWGHESVHRFIGMFAIAIWDDEEKRLFLFRDRVGVKPLYYGWDGHTFWFGSEMKALLAFRHWTPEINKQAMGEFLQYGYIAPPRSIFKQVSKLIPGHWLEVNSTSAEQIIRQYWSLLDASSESTDKNEEELADELEKLIISAFQYRMVSDVPVGVFLSGGIDSSIVAAILQKHSGQQIQTFTIGFEDKKCDESEWAKKVADHIGTCHTEFSLDLDKSKELIPKLPGFYDEPFGDPSSIPTLMVASLAGRDVKVVLSADGGDELFAGYSSYILNPERLKRISNLPYWLRWLMGKGLSLLPIAYLAKILSSTSIFSKELPSDLLRKAMKLEAVLPDVTPSDVFQASESYWLPSEVNKLIGGGYEDPRSPVEHYSGGYEEQMALWDFHHYLPEDIMTKVDRATMAVSIEGREPLLDHRLIEFAFRLPLKYRIGKLGQKHLLRKVLYKYVPRNLIDRPKQGFTIPINKWMRDGNASLANSLLSDDSSLGKYLDMSVVKDEVDLLKKSGVNETRVWFLFVLDQWLREYDSCK